LHYVKLPLSLHIENLKMRIRNRALLDKFVKKHADSIKAMQKFVDIVEEAEWHNVILNNAKQLYYLM